MVHSLTARRSSLMMLGEKKQPISATPYPILLRGLLIILMATARFVPGRRARYTFALAPHPMSSSTRQPMTRLPMRLSGRFAPPPCSVGGAAMRACGARAERRLIHARCLIRRFARTSGATPSTKLLCHTNKGLRLPDEASIILASAIPFVGHSTNKSGIWYCPSGSRRSRTRTRNREANVIDAARAYPAFESLQGHLRAISNLLFSSNLPDKACVSGFYCRDHRHEQPRRGEQSPRGPHQEGAVSSLGRMRRGRGTEIHRPPATAFHISPRLHEPRLCLCSHDGVLRVGFREDVLGSSIGARWRTARGTS